MLGVESTGWKVHLNASSCSIPTRLIYYVFTYNLDLTTHQSIMSEEMAYLVAMVLKGENADLGSALCARMIGVIKAMDSKTNMPFLVILTTLLLQNKVPVCSPTHL